MEIQQDNSSSLAVHQHHQQQQQHHKPDVDLLSKGQPDSAGGSAPVQISLPDSAIASDADAPSVQKQQLLRLHQLARWARQFALDNFMLLSFSLAAALAMAWPMPGKAVASWAVGDVRIVQAANNFLVFLISGLTLKSDDFRCASATGLATQQQCACVAAHVAVGDTAERRR
jgi:hypothetical protein